MALMRKPVIDETLLNERRVTRATASDDGTGYEVQLSCGHTIWIAVQPADRMHCGQCLNQLVMQAREVQAQQEQR
jgi:hypothetical protein